MLVRSDLQLAVGFSETNSKQMHIYFYNHYYYYISLTSFFQDKPGTCYESGGKDSRAQDSAAD